MEEIEKLRSCLDEIDRELLGLLIKRMKIVRRVASIKKRHNMSILDEKREEEVYANVTRIASKQDLDSYQIKSIFHEILLLSKRVQNEVLEQWRYVSGIINAWGENPTMKLPQYPAGTWGPDVARDFMEKDGRVWREPS